jgi:hypothetical protein
MACGYFFCATYWSPLLTYSSFSFWGSREHEAVVRARMVHEMTIDLADMGLSSMVRLFGDASASPRGNPLEYFK